MTCVIPWMLMLDNSTMSVTSINVSELSENRANMRVHAHKRWTHHLLCLICFLCVTTSKLQTNRIEYNATQQAHWKIGKCHFGLLMIFQASIHPSQCHYETMAIMDDYHHSISLALTPFKWLNRQFYLFLFQYTNFFVGALLTSVLSSPPRCSLLISLLPP